VMRCDAREGGIGSLKAKSAVSGNFAARGKLVRQLSFGLKIGGEPCRGENWEARCLKWYWLILSTRERELQYAISETYQQATAE
jgi:hypothetical protein